MASVLKVDKLDPQSGTALEIGSSGDTITVPSGATFAVSGTMNASSITAGTLATARGGSGRAVITGNILQVVQSTTTSAISTSATSFAATGFTSSITPTLSDSKILVLVAGGKLTNSGTARAWLNMYTQTGGGGYSDLFMIIKDNYQSGTQYGQTFSNAYLHSPATTSQVDYQMYLYTNAATIYINDSGQIAVTMLEIGA